MKGKVNVIVGLQYGDEGKGRASHYEAQNASIVIRATGGNNAGHTVVKNGVKYALHLLPSSIIEDGVKSIIGPGVVVDLQGLCKELVDLAEQGIKINPEKLAISERATVLLPHHKVLDELYEEYKENKIGTTKRGIGPCYAEKCNRTAMKMKDLKKSDFEIAKKIKEAIRPANILLKDAGKEEISFEQEMNICIQYGKLLEKYICDTTNIIKEAHFRGDKIVIEGAQSLFLDIDHGDYPFVTSSNPNAAGTCSGAGIGPTLVNEVIGVMKAYTSRVGEGPFITEENSEIGDLIRVLGHEYGTTTGRPRRCGWLDLVMISYASFVNGVTGLCINHVDTIGKLDQINVCTKYIGKEGCYPEEKNEVRAVYEVFEGGWSTTGVKSYEDLPKKAKVFLEFIEEYTGVPIKYIGIGADDKDTIVK